MRKVLVLALSLLALLPLAARADDSIVKFDGGIGVIPISNVALNAAGNVVITRNTVRGVDPAGQIWVISDLKANVKADGRIKVDGRGLLLGGGNNIGNNAEASVIATLICEMVAPFTQRSTAVGVPLEPDGDFRIDAVLSPAPPADCASPVLLIRNAVNLGWFAAGIIKR